MTIKIMADKVAAKSIAKNQQDLNKGYRLKAIKAEGIDKENLESMITRLRKLAHAKEPNQINRESARMTSKKLSTAIEKIDIAMVTNNAITENPLLSTVSAASNVLKFKPSSVLSAFDINDNNVV